MRKSQIQGLFKDIQGHIYQQIQGLINYWRKGVRNQQNLTLNCSKRNFNEFQTALWEMNISKIVQNKKVRFECQTISENIKNLKQKKSKEVGKKYSVFNESLCMHGKVTRFPAMYAFSMTMCAFSMYAFSMYACTCTRFPCTRFPCTRFPWPRTRFHVRVFHVRVYVYAFSRQHSILQLQYAYPNMLIIIIKKLWLIENNRF